jgi:hypothetical protein
MKYLTVDDYFSPSVNIRLAGLSPEAETKRLVDCVAFIKKINDHLKFDDNILCIAVYLFCIYAKKFTFAEFNMYMACGMSHFIAAKVEYKHPSTEFYEKFAHEQQPASKPVKGKTNKVVPFEEVKEALHKEAMRIELDILTVIGFDFEFDFPFTYIEKYMEGSPSELIKQTLKSCVSAIYLTSP